VSSERKGPPRNRLFDGTVYGRACLKLDLLPEGLGSAGNRVRKTVQGGELPMTVKEAAIFLGVSGPNGVSFGLSGKQIPPSPRVMGRNIRFLKSDLEALPRRVFKQEVEEWARTEVDMTVFCIGTKGECLLWWMRYRDKRGQRRFESTGCTELGKAGEPETA